MMPPMKLRDLPRADPTASSGAGPRADAGALPDSLDPVLRGAFMRRGASAGADELSLELRGLLPLLERSTASDRRTRCSSPRTWSAVAHPGRRRLRRGRRTSTALGPARQLARLGHTNAGMRVPDRMRHGYGLTRRWSRTVDEQADLLVTVDNGVSAYAGIEAAHELGMEVLVTDHHLPGPALPDALRT